MTELALPQTTSEGLQRTRAGLLWRVVARAARVGDWESWAEHLASEMASGEPIESPEMTGFGAGDVSLPDLLSGAEGDSETVRAASAELCRGLALYLEALPPRERVRSAGRVAKLLHLASQRTPLRPFEQLIEVPPEDQASIWDTVLRVLVAEDRDEGPPESWLEHTDHLPEHLHERWLQDLERLDITDRVRERIAQRLGPPTAMAEIDSPVEAPEVVAEGPPPGVAETEADAVPPGIADTGQERRETAETEAPAVPPSATSEARPLGEPPESAEASAAPEPITDTATPDVPADAFRTADVADDVNLERASDSEVATDAPPERPDTAVAAEEDANLTAPARPKPPADDTMEALGAEAAEHAPAAESPPEPAPEPTVHRVPRLPAEAHEEPTEDSASPDLVWVRPDEMETQQDLPALRFKGREPQVVGPPPVEAAEAADETESPAAEPPPDPDDTLPARPQALAARDRGRPPRRAPAAWPHQVREEEIAPPLDLRGGYAGKPIPRALRVLGVLTGMIVVAALVRLILRFLLGSRQEGRLWIEQGRLYLESTRYLLGREVRHTRQSFGPRAILWVAREVRFPFLYLFIGLFALCLGTFVGALAFLDGHLAGFEAWMRIGLILVAGGLLIDFLFTVVGSRRPGTTTLTLHVEPRTTIRILGVEEDAADQMLEALARLSVES